MKSLNDVKAKIMMNWNRARNPGCKFISHDKATYSSNCSRDSKVLQSYDGKTGIVVAVTTGGNGLIRNGSWRCYTKYYLEFEDGTVHGCLSGNLTKVENEVKKIKKETRKMSNEKIYKVINIGCYYSTYEDMAKMIGLTNWEKYSEPDVGDKFRIISKAKHLGDSKIIVCAIEDINTGEQFLIGGDGIEEIIIETPTPQYKTAALIKGLPYFNGYEYEEFRRPERGESYVNMHNEISISDGDELVCRLILKKI